MPAFMVIHNNNQFLICWNVSTKFSNLNEYEAEIEQNKI